MEHRRTSFRVAVLLNFKEIYIVWLKTTVQYVHQLPVLRPPHGEPHHAKACAAGEDERTDNDAQCTQPCLFSCGGLSNP